MSDRTILLKSNNEEPLIRVGLFRGQRHIDFVLKQPFDVQDLNGNVVISNVDSRLRWRIKIKEKQPGEEVFELILWEGKNKEEAREKLERLQKTETEAKMMEIGGDIYLNDKFIQNNLKYRLISGQYQTEDEAVKAMVNFRPMFNPIIDRVITQKPGGRVELFDSEYEYSTELDDGLKIVPHDQNAVIHLFEIKKYDSFLQKEYFRDYYYNGSIEFIFDANGMLQAVNEIPLEVYLKRTVYSESAENLHLEFYKALTISIRSEILSRIGHNHISEEYDFCDWGHCMRYYGDKFNEQNINSAVDETKGTVIKLKDGHLLDAFFHTVCGGHTEDSYGLWDTRDEANCSGKYDEYEIPDGFTGLNSEEKVKQWIYSRPKTFCNLQGQNIPKSLIITNRFFRWEVFYSRKEMRDLIKKKVGLDLGELIDIVPIKRSNSGRIKEVELIGTLKSISVKGELNIRSTLSYEYLESSCFIVEKELDESGFPLSFTFFGAGQGHGMGMCKAGAAVMAQKDQNYKDIIRHYFNCDGLDKLY